MSYKVLGLSENSKALNHCLKTRICLSVVLVYSLQSCLTFVTPWTVAPRLLRTWDFPDKNTGVDCHSLLQGSFPTQGSNPGLLRCRQILYQPSHRGGPEPRSILTAESILGGRSSYGHTQPHKNSPSESSFGLTSRLFPVLLRLSSGDGKES